MESRTLRPRVIIATVTGLLIVFSLSFFAHDNCMKTIIMPREDPPLAISLQAPPRPPAKGLSAELSPGMQNSSSEFDSKLLSRLPAEELSTEPSSAVQNSSSAFTSKINNFHIKPHKRRKEKTSGIWELRHNQDVYKRELPNWSSIWKMIRIYVYPDMYVKGGKMKQKGYSVTETFLYEQIRRVAVKNPNDANLFCMPINTINWLNTINATSIAEMNAYFNKLYTKYPHWETAVRRGLLNHFFIVGHDVGGYRASGSKFYLDRSILLANSASSCMGQISCGELSWYGATTKYYSIGKDVSMVAFPSVWDPKTKSYPKLQKQRPKPRLTALFIGGWKQRAPSMDLLEADPRVHADPKWHIEHTGPSDKKHGKKHAAREKNYWKMLQESKFALHFHGWQPFSARLFEIIAAGTVPVIISPGYVLPFEDFLDWSTFSISVTGHRISHLYSILSNITDAQYDTLLRNVGKISHHFRYNDPPEPGDAFYMTMLTTYFRSQTINLPYVSGATQPGDAPSDYAKEVNR